MSADDRKRDAERRFVESRSLADEAALVRELMRSGALDPRRVQLAAYLDHVPSRLALDLHEPDEPEGLEEWFSGLASWGRVAFARAGLAILRPLVAIFEELHEDDCVREALNRLSDWCDCPCAAHAQISYRQCGAVYMAAHEQYSRDQVAFAIAQVAAGACSVPERTSLGSFIGHYGELLEPLLDGFRMRPIVEQELVPWALTRDAGAAEHGNLQLRWQHSADPAQELELLRQRLERNEVSLERLRLAAFLGHEPSRELLGQTETIVPTVVSDPAFRRWFRLLAAHGAEATLRAALPIAEALEGNVQRWAGHEPEHLEALRTVRHAATAWARCPCEDHAHQLAAARASLSAILEVAPREPEPAPVDEPEPGEDDPIALVAHRMRTFVMERGRHAGPRAHATALAHDWLARIPADPKAAGAFADQVVHASERHDAFAPDIHQDVVSKLLLWALDYDDSLGRAP